MKKGFQAFIAFSLVFSIIFIFIAGLFILKPEYFDKFSFISGKFISDNDNFQINALDEKVDGIVKDYFDKWAFFALFLGTIIILIIFTIRVLKRK